MFELLVLKFIFLTNIIIKDLVGIGIEILMTCVFFIV